MKKIKLHDRIIQELRKESYPKKKMQELQNRNHNPNKIEWAERISLNYMDRIRKTENSQSLTDKYLESQQVMQP